MSEAIILRDLEGLDERFNLFQIDDGYETFVGDWLDVDKEKFPNGLEPVVKKIKEKGFKAGIWLAPFAAESKSRIFNEHPEYFRRDEKGNPIPGGGNWSTFYCLDLENEEVWAYIEKSLKHYKDMGFDFFKLDFLYVASLPSYKGKTRAEMADYAYKRLRKILGKALILGCGSTLGQAASSFDYNRVGPDVSLEFNDVWYMKYMHRERVSTKVTLQNTVYRSFMNRRLFGNDPDVFLLRDDNIKMSKKQRESLITINSLFGQVLLTSDDLLEYDEEKKDLLAKSLNLFKNAKDQTFVRLGDYLVIKYTLEGKENKLIYDTKKGVFTHGR
ncbi:MAG: alpha-galactosidase [Bacilli bacterium]|nr:alpha-galactosidase [Bacilli bacterium]